MPHLLIKCSIDQQVVIAAEMPALPSGVQQIWAIAHLQRIPTP
ncbi:MAG: hypothetical protein WBA57_18930 [Elainellaceae cyanobacterium]